MEASVDRDDLAAVAAVAHRCARASRWGLDVLPDLGLVATGDVVRVTTSGRVAVALEVPGAVKTEGHALVGVATFAGIARALPDGEVHLHADGSDLVVASGHFRARLPLREQAPYDLAEPVPLSSWSVEARALARALDFVAPAVSHDRNRPVLCGVCWEPDPEAGSVLVATDSYRMSVAPLAAGPDRQVIVAGEATRELRRLLDGARETVEAGLLARGDGGRPVALRVRGLAHGGVLTAALVDGEFPAWRRFLTERRPTRQVILPRAAVAAALRRVRLVADGSYVRLKVDDEGATLQAASADVGAATERLTWAEYGGGLLEGGPVEVAFDPGYLADALGAFEGILLAATIEEPLKPVELRDGDRTHLLMPVRTGREAS